MPINKTKKTCNVISSLCLLRVFLWSAGFNKIQVQRAGETIQRKIMSVDLTLYSSCSYTR